jgi:hypothetical protein
MIISTDAKAIYSQYGIDLDDVDAVLVAHNCNTQAISSSKTAEEWAHTWAKAENVATDVTYEEASRGY